jgi:hypothetical protein
MHHMRKGITAALLSGGAMALSLGLGLTTASATTAATWSVSPGGTSSISGSAQVKDEATGTVAKCTKVTLTGTLKSGTGLSGTKIATVTAASFTGCTIATIAITVKTEDLPWAVDALTYNASKGQTTAKLVGVELAASAPGCDATLEGTTAKNGFTKFTYTNSSGKLALLGPGGNLEAAGVSGCFGLINNGDKQQASGSTTVSPKQTITSP